MRGDSFDYDRDLSGLDYEPPERRVLPSALILSHFILQPGYWTVFNSNLSYFAYAEYSSRTLFTLKNAGDNYVFQRRIQLRRIFVEYAF